MSHQILYENFGWNLLRRDSILAAVHEMEGISTQRSTLHSRTAPFALKLSQIGKEPLYLWIHEKMEVLVFRDGHRIRAVQSLCPHMGARLECSPRKDRIHCPWHGLSFCAGTLKSDHSTYKQLHEFQTEIAGDTLLIYA